MANKLYEENSIQAIANAIRAKGQTGTMTVDQMAEKIGAIQTGIEPQAYEWQQTKAQVQAFLDYMSAHPYSPDDYTTSYFDTHTVDFSDNPERPKGQAVNTDAGVLDAGGYKKTVTAGSNTIYNVVPNIATPYTLDASGEVKQTGTLTPNKPLRQIMASTRNFRDLGGWACDGGHVKYGILYRAGELNGNDADVVLNQLGIKTELDLTGDGTHGAITGLKYAGYVGGYAMYALTPVEAWKVNIRAVFDAAKYNEPLVFHCAAGADRTGTLACVIEGMLGVSQSNLDVDYELTSFYQYNGRKRNEDYQGGGGADWRRLINQIKAVSGTTFRDKCVNFVASLGFTAAEINAFRSAMIEGNPQTVTPDIDTFTVTNNLSHATSDNSATSVTEFQPYEANIAAASGYAISSVQILMNNVDITAQVWDGKQTNLYRAIQKTLTHCTMDNIKVSVIDGQGFAAEVTADAGYTFDGATVSITMDGVDITDQVWRSGIEPSGTKSIVENGSYDVLEYETADVNVPVPTVTSKTYDISFATTKSGWVTLVSSLDADVLAHINDTNMKVSLIRMDDYTYQWYSGVFYSATNHPFMFINSEMCYGFATRTNSETAIGIAWMHYPANNTDKTGTTSQLAYGAFCLDGNAYLLKPSDGLIAAGNYKLTFNWG